MRALLLGLTLLFFTGPNATILPAPEVKDLLHDDNCGTPTAPTLTLALKRLRTNHYVKNCPASHVRPLDSYLLGSMLKAPRVRSHSKYAVHQQMNVYLL